MPPKFLQPDFEEQLTAVVDDDGRVVIAGTPFTAVALLKGDEIAYQSEFAGWYERWIESQRVLLDEILQYGGNEKRFEDICKLASDESLIPLVGSGLSAPSDMPTWSEFLRKLRSHSTLTVVDLDDLIAEGRFEEAAEALIAKMPGRLFDERLEHELRLAPGREVQGAIRLLPSVFPRIVATTNFDELIEAVYRNHDTPFASVLVGEEIADYRRRGPEPPTLLKLHGTVTSAAKRVLTTSEYEAAYGAGAGGREELTLICRTKALLCLGCSLGQDRTVALLHELAESDKAMPRHYALVRAPAGQDEVTAREHFLTERNIFPIWYEGDHDESITAILTGLAFRLGVLP